MKSFLSMVHSVLALTISIALFSCGDPGESESKGKRGQDSDALAYGKVNLTSSQLNGAALQDVGNIDGCGFSVDIYRGEGSCTTPTDFKGYARMINAQSLTDNNPESGNARIAGVAGGLGEEAGAIFTGSEFSFKDQSAFNAQFQVVSATNFPNKTS